MRHRDAASSRHRSLVAWGLGLLVGLIYLSTMYPSIVGGDGGELMGVACTWGVAHPPGYPLFTLLGGLFHSVPLGNPGWRISLVSVVSGVAAAMLFCASVNRVTSGIWGGFVAGGLFALSPLVWSYATQAEVFALNHVFLGLMLYTYVVHVQRPTWRTFKIFFFVFGLALSNHHTSAFMGAPFSLLMLTTRLRARGPGDEDDLPEALPLADIRAWGWAVLLGAAGLLSYLYLPIASVRNPIIAWGDITSLEGFLTHLLRKEYGTFRLSSLSLGGEESTLLASLRGYFSHVASTTYYVGAFGLLAGLGFYLIWKPRTREDLRKFLFATLLAFYFYVVVFFALAKMSLHTALFQDFYMRFWQMADFFVFGWIGVGFASGAEWLDGWAQRKQGDPEEVAPEAPSVGSLPKALRLAVPIVAMGLVLMQAGLHYRKQDQSSNWTIHHYGRGLLENLPEHSILLSKGDLQTNGTRYQQLCEGFREDVHIVDRSLLQYRWQKRILAKHYADVEFPGTHYSAEPGGFSLVQFLRANQSRHRIFVSDLYASDDLASWKDEYFLRTAGTHAEVLPVGTSLDPGLYLRETTHGLSRTRFWMDRPEIRSFKHGAWEVLAWQDRVEAPGRIGFQLLDYAKRDRGDVALARAGVQWIEESLALRPEFPTLGGVPPLAWRELGMGLEQVARSSQDDDERETARQKMLHAYGNYLAAPLAGDADLPRIRTLVESGGVPR